MSFRIKLLLSFLLYGFLLVAVSQFIMFASYKKALQEDSIDQIQHDAQMLENDFENFVKRNAAQVKSLAESKLLHDVLSNKLDISILKTEFYDFANCSDVMMQVRYLDANGDEIVRVERLEQDKEPFITKNLSLQNKKNRYYFQEVMQLERGMIWYSKVDLNIEHGKIVVPYEPTIRIATPVYVKGVKEGMIIINLFLKKYLHTLLQNPNYEAYIVDDEGYILAESSHKYCWSRYLPEHRREYTVSHENRSVTYPLQLNNGERLSIVLYPKKELLDQVILEKMEELFWIFLGLFAFSIPFSYIISKYPAQLNEEMIQLNKRIKKASNEKDMLLSLFDLSSSVLFKWNNDETWSVSLVSRSVYALMGYTKEEFESNKIVYSNCIHKDDLGRVTQEVLSAIDKELFFFKHEPYRIITKDGQVKWISDQTVIARDEEGNIVSFIGYLSDITEIKQKEYELENIARTDQLTKIPNRVALDEVLITQHYRFQRNNEACSVIMVDIDYFKEVNDQFGHIVGDKVLSKFAQILRENIREGDIVGRWGGEEFLIILPHTTKDKASILAEKLRKLIATQKFDEVGVKTASFGVCELGENMSIEKLVDGADQALYRAKTDGRNRVKVCGEV